MERSCCSNLRHLEIFFLGITSNLKFFLLGFKFLKLRMQVAIFFGATQRTTMASHGTSPSSQSPAMLPAGRHEPFVQRKARRRPYRRCPLVLGGPLMFGGVFGNSGIFCFFCGGAKQLLVPGIFLMIQEKGGERDLWWNSGVPVSFCFFFASLVHFGVVSFQRRNQPRAFNEIDDDKFVLQVADNLVFPFS